MGHNLTLNCTTLNCPHYRTCCHLPTEVHDVKGKVDIFIVGQGAGWQEEKTKRPWIGKAGQLLRTNIKEVYNAHEHGPLGVALGNTVRCRPTSTVDGKTKDRVPTDEEVMYCLKYLEKDIKEVKPSIILLAGGHAASVFGWTDSVGKLRGKFRKTNSVDYDWDPDVMITYHPAGVLRQQGFLEPFKQDLRSVYYHAIIQRGAKADTKEQMDLFAEPTK